MCVSTCAYMCHNCKDISCCTLNIDFSFKSAFCFSVENFPLCVLWKASIHVEVKELPSEVRSPTIGSKTQTRVIRVFFNLLSHLVSIAVFVSISQSLLDLFVFFYVFVCLCVYIQVTGG